jgi:hypothetical protein
VGECPEGVGEGGVGELEDLAGDAQAHGGASSRKATRRPTPLLRAPVTDSRWNQLTPTQQAQVGKYRLIHVQFTAGTAADLFPLAEDGRHGRHEVGQRLPGRRSRGNDH